MHEAVHPAIQQAAWTAVGSVPGCALAHVSFANAKNSSSPFRSMSVGITGWSPSLHVVEHEWRIPMDMGSHRTRPDHEVHAELLVRQMEGLIAEQRRRAADGLALGTPTPFRTDGNALKLEHLHCDASQIGIVIYREMREGIAPDVAIRRKFGTAIADAHRSAMEHRGGPILDGTACLVAERAGTRVMEITHDLADDATEKVAMRGARVMVSGFALPETVLRAAEGMRFGRIASFHPMLDDRLITGVMEAAGTIAFDLEPCTIRIGDVLRLGAHEAIDILQARVGGRGA